MSDDRVHKEAQLTKLVDTIKHIESLNDLLANHLANSIMAVCEIAKKQKIQMPLHDLEKFDRLLKQTKLLDEDIGGSMGNYEKLLAYFQKLEGERSDGKYQTLDDLK